MSVFYNYQFSYFNDNFEPLYDRAFTSSQLGLQASIPLFRGASRIYNLQAAKLESERLTYARTELQNQIETEYAQAAANYRGALANWRLQQQNEQLAREVYQVIQLQYDEGIIPYLEVIQAETDLRSAQLNTSNALLRVLSSKVRSAARNRHRTAGRTKRIELNNVHEAILTISDDGWAAGRLWRRVGPARSAARARDGANRRKIHYHLVSNLSRHGGAT